MTKNDVKQCSVLLFIASLSFSKYLATKCVSLNDESCMFRTTLIDLNIIEFKYYAFMISLDTCNGSCNVLSLKKWVSKKKIKTHKC